MSSENQGMQVTIMPNAVNVAMNTVDDRLTTHDFETRQDAPKVHTGELNYYIGLDEQGLMVRCASMAQPDRKAVAALVGGWVADGIIVQQVNRKELLKHLRKLDAAAKNEEKPAAQEAEPKTSLESSPAQSAPPAATQTAPAEPEQAALV